MKKNTIIGWTGLAFAVVCRAQNVVPPPPDCLQQAKVAGRTLQAAAVGCPSPLAGIGTVGTVPVFTSPNSVGDSVIVQNSSGGIGIGAPAAGATKLKVAGSVDATGAIHATGDITSNGAMGTQGVTLQGGNVTAGGTVSAGGTITSGSQFNIGPNRVLGINGVANTFTGINAGTASSGSFNSFFGTNTGTFNQGSDNAVFGAGAAENNSNGSDNSIFGTNAGHFNSSGSRNSFFGMEAGNFNNGTENTFVGQTAGKAFATGSNVTLLGAGTTAKSGIHNATAIGSKSLALDDNTLILGAVDGYNGATGVKVGIGTPSPQSRLEVGGGDIYLSTPATGIILRTPGGFNCFRLSINISFQLTTTSVSCPGNTGF